MADFLSFNEGRKEIANNGLPSTVYFLLSTKDCATHAVTDTLAGGVGEITGTGYARQSEAEPTASAAAHPPRRCSSTISSSRPGCCDRPTRLVASRAMSLHTGPPTAESPHATATSTGTGDVKALTPPSNAYGCFITVKTTAARVTFDGSAPAPGGPNGLVIPAGGPPVFFSFAKLTKFCADVAGNSEVNVLWTS